MTAKNARPKIGRPREFKTEDDLKEAVNSYFQDTDEEDLTITGLALALGFESRQSIYDYEKHSEFSYVIKRARLLVENGYEKDLKHGKMAAIFPLKNMGWSDRQEITSTVESTNTEKADYPELKNMSPEDLEEFRRLAKIARGD